MPLRAPKGFIDESDPKVCQIGHPAPPWLVNYADLMTEMVCFFVILYALSASLDKGMQKGQEEIEKIIKEEGLKGAKVEMTEEGLKVTLEEQRGDVSYFESGFAEVTDTMRDVLDKVAPALKTMAMGNKQILVQGHTDDVPIHNDYFWSNWELSTARATTVVEHLVREKGLPPACMAAVGFGEFQPVCQEATPECRARNRRVVFLVKSPALSGVRECAAGPGVPSPSTGLRQEGEEPVRSPRPREEPPT
ncbi:MAG: flagellar motor protein MotB [Elusimicrobiota bacterium]